MWRSVDRLPKVSLIIYQSGMARYAVRTCSAFASMLHSAPVSSVKGMLRLVEVGGQSIDNEKFMRSGRHYA
jgi:hypothetical protein